MRYGRRHRSAWRCADRYRDLSMTPTPDEDLAMVARLRNRDEQAFALVVDRYTPAMLRVARGYVSSQQVAEDVVQEAWIGVLRGIATFEGRCSLRSWIFTVLINTAKSRGRRDRREADARREISGVGSVEPGRFHSPGEPWAGHWRDGQEPRAFPETPEASALAAELLALARRELDKLPERQRAVVTLRDLVGMDSQEVCEVLGLTPANQRVLLHRGRSAIRAGLEDYVVGVR